MTVLLVACGGAIGAPLRYLLDRRVQRSHDTPFPWGTLAVNVTGSFVLGLLTALATAGALPRSLGSLLGVGLCGALTTFSTFGYETVRLFSERARLYGLVNVGVSVLAGFGAAGAGILVGLAVTG